MVLPDPRPELWIVCRHKLHVRATWVTHTRGCVQICNGESYNGPFFCTEVRKLMKSRPSWAVRDWEVQHCIPLGGNAV